MVQALAYKMNGTTYSAFVKSSQKTTNSSITLFTNHLDVYRNSDENKNSSVSM